MVRKIVAIHGIGNAQPGWSEFLRLELGIPKENWLEFYYDDLLDKSIFSKLLISFVRKFLKHLAGPEAAILDSISREYVNDILSYFLQKGMRAAIQSRLSKVLESNPDAIILSHSLGTVVVYETLKNFRLKAHTLFTFGSPLSKDLVKRFLQVPDFRRPKVVDWINVWGRFDPIGGKVTGLGCKVKDQIRINNAHDLFVYVHSQKQMILALYGEEGKQVS